MKTFWRFKLRQDIIEELSKLLKFNAAASVLDKDCNDHIIIIMVGGEWEQTRDGTSV